MSSNVADLLYGYLLEAAIAMNSVLQQFLVGERRTRYLQVLYTEYTPVACIMNNTVFSQARA